VSTDEERRLAAREEQDALAAVRLASMNRRLAPSCMLIPVIISVRHPSGRISITPPEARGWLLPGRGLILDEPIKLRDRLAPSPEDFERGRILGLSDFAVRVPEWFLDGGDW
jgi:hypothetical protein